jgi:SNF2 family DNA or RNA helicase
MNVNLLSPHQDRIVQYITNIRETYPSKGCNVRADAGLGKTRSALAALVAATDAKRCLVMVPLSVIGQWKTEWTEKMGMSGDDIHLYYGTKRYVDNIAKITITTHGIMMHDLKRHVDTTTTPQSQDTLFHQKWDILVIDECHKFGNLVRSNAVGRTLPLYGHIFNELRYNFVILLSATPFGRGQDNIHSMIRLLKAEDILLKNGNTMETVYNLLTVDEKRAKHMSIPTKDVHSRYLTFQCAKMRDTHCLLAEKLKKTERKLQIARKDPSRRGNIHALTIARDVCVTRMRMFESGGQPTREDMLGVTLVEFASFPKTRYVLTEIKKVEKGVLTAPPHEQRIVLTSSFSSVLRTWERYLRTVLDTSLWTVDVYDGATSMDDRSTIQNAFNTTTRPRILLLSKSAGGVGLNLFGAYMMILNPSHTFVEEEQVMSRIQRMGQTHHVTIQTILIKNGFEESLRQSQLRQIDGMSKYVNMTAVYMSYFLPEEIVRFRKGKTSVSSVQTQKNNTKRRRLLETGKHPTIVLFEDRSRQVQDTAYVPASNIAKRVRRQCTKCKIRVKHGSLECSTCSNKTVYTCIHCRSHQSMSFDVCQTCHMLR